MQEIIIDNSVTNYDQCYLKAIEEGNKFFDRMSGKSINENHWFYKEIRKAIKYYGEMAGVKEV